MKRFQFEKYFIGPIMCWLLCLRCMPSMPTLCLRLAALICGATATFFSAATVSTFIPHTNLANDINDKTRGQMAGFGYAIAEALAVSSKELSPYEDQPCNNEYAEGNCQLGMRFQKYLIFLAREVYRQNSTDIEQSISTNWTSICTGFMGLTLAVGISGCMVMIGALTKRSTFLCPWQLQVVVYFIATLSSSILALYRALELQLDLKSFLLEEEQAIISRFCKVAMGISMALAFHMVILHRLATRLSKNTVVASRTGKATVMAKSGFV
jgi:hypothetical protein